MNAVGPFGSADRKQARFIMSNCGIHHFASDLMYQKGASALFYCRAETKTKGVLTFPSYKVACGETAAGAIAIAVCVINDGLTFPRELT